MGWQPTRVFRYADTSRVLIIRVLWSCDWFAIPSYDSVWLSTDSSFTRRKLFYCFGDLETNSYDKRSISLRSLTLVSVEEEKVLPVRADLLPPYPNPFNSSTSISFVSAKRGRVVIRVVDILGREIDRIFDGSSEIGRTTLSWDSSRNSSGVYFVIMEADGSRFVRRLLLLR